MTRAVGDRVRLLADGWRMAVTAAGACPSPAEAAGLTDWIAARAPGTAAEALEAAGRWRRDAPESLHDKDVWWRMELPESGRRRLRFEGLATIAEIWIDEAPLATSMSMFAPVEVEAQIARGAVLWMCFRALAPRLAAKGPRARWRPMMMDAQGLRLVRTTALGHMPGWLPPIHAVGPWRPVSLIEPSSVRIADVRLQADWDGAARLVAELSVDGAGDVPVLSCGGASVQMMSAGEGRFRAELRPDAEPWFPHTHGDQPLYPVEVQLGARRFDLARVGFRRVAADRGADGQGFSLRINGETVFCRGACWITPELTALGGGREAYEPTLRLAREAGFNMVRVSGVGVYETAVFFELCDELGLLVWQDFMFANFDYPASDPGFVDLVRREAVAFLEGLQGAPSLAVLCGGSEVMQQAAMMGLPVGELPWPLFDEVLAEAAARWRPDAVYVPNTPWGGALPFAADAGVTHYYGVGAYERPLEDARRAGVRFASECLAFANVPQAESLRGRLNAPAVHDPRWKAAVPRDRGASWDFEDVRDHYLGRLFGEDPARLRREQPELYLDLSRAVSGEAMAATLAEWRRLGSSCAGGLIWTLRDQVIGAGWGLIDALGEPKPAWHAVRRVCQPVQVLLTDEGVNGLAVHLLNERARPVEATLRLAVFAEEAGPLIEVRLPMELGPRSAEAVPAFALIGRFFDLTYAYRFGPLSHAAVAAQLLSEDDLLSQAVYVPPAVQGWGLGGQVEAVVEPHGDEWRLTLTAERFQRFVHIADTAFRSEDDWLPLLPGEPRMVRLLRRPDAGGDAVPGGQVLAPGGRLLGAYRGG